MLIKITCMCGKTSDWDLQSNNVFLCTCGKKLNVASIFIKNKFKIAILENLRKERKSARIIPNLFMPWLSLIIPCFCFLPWLLASSTSATLVGAVLFFILCFVGALVSAVILTLKGLARKRLVQNGYSVIGVARQKGLEPDARTLHIQPKGRKYSIQSC